MITHTNTFETLAKAPIKQSDVIVAKQVLTETGYVDDTLWTSSDALMQVSIDAVGEMFGTVTKKAVVGLLGTITTVKSGDLYKIRLGVKDAASGTFNYISEGYYLVDTVDVNYEAGSTTITMYDHMWTAGTSVYADVVTSSAIEYPITLEDFAGKMAEELDVDLMSGFSSLPNSQLNIVEDLYTPITGATIMDAIRDVAGATGTTARITDRTLVFSQYSVTTENLDSDVLKSLKIGDTYGPITSVALGRVPQNDNIAINATTPAASTVTAVNTTTNVLTIVAHGMPDGNLIQFQTTGAFPAPIQAGVNYYVRSVSVDTFSLAPTYSDAIAGTNLIDLTTSGSGAISVSNLPTKEIQINNNQILDDYRQDALPPLYNKIAGIDWTDVQSETIGLAWHEVGDVIKFTQGSRTVKAFISEIHMTFAGSIKESIISKIPVLAAINYQTAGGILKTLYNAEIKVDKQANEISSIVSEQQIVNDQVAEDFTRIDQSIDKVNISIQNAGGGNLILNSVGLATEDALDAASKTYKKLVAWDYKGFDGTSTYPNYTVTTHGTVVSTDSSTSQNYGGVSGRAVQIRSDYLTNKGVRLTQRMGVAVGTPLSFGMRVYNAFLTGHVLITLSNTNETRYVYLNSSTTYNWAQIVSENFTSTLPWLDITIESSAEAFQFTDLRLMYGPTLQKWAQAYTEIMSTNVQFNENGMRIFDNLHDTETRVSYNDFSTIRRSDGVVLFRADDTGVRTNDLTVRGSSDYYTEGKSVIKQITIPLTNAKGGIAFLKGVNA